MSIENKLEKLSQAIEGKYAEFHNLSSQNLQFEADLQKLRETRPHPLVLLQIDRDLTDIKYELGKLSFLKDQEEYICRALSLEIDELTGQLTDWTDKFDSLFREVKLKYAKLMVHISYMEDFANKFRENNAMTAEDLYTNVVMCHDALSSKNDSHANADMMKKVIKAAVSEKTSLAEELNALEAQYNSLRSAN